MRHHQHFVRQKRTGSLDVLRFHKLRLRMRAALEGLFHLLGETAPHLALLVLLNLDTFHFIFRQLVLISIRNRIPCVVLVCRLVLKRLLRWSEMCWLLLDACWNRAVILELVRVACRINSLQAWHVHCVIAIHCMLWNHSNALHQLTFLRTSDKVSALFALKSSSVVGAEVPLWLIAVVTDLASLFV